MQNPSKSSDKVEKYFSINTSDWDINLRKTIEEAEADARHDIEDDVENQHTDENGLTEEYYVVQIVRKIVGKAGKTKITTTKVN